MKKKAAFLGVLLSMLMMASSAWAADFTVARDMNFRAAPAVTGQRIGSVPKGAVVSKIGEMNGWDNVTYRGVTGWIHGGNLMTAEQAAEYFDIELLDTERRHSRPERRLQPEQHRLQALQRRRLSMPG